MTDDYLKYYDLEKYLFSEVGSRFATLGKITPIDFYMIIIWKSNRAKTRIRDKLRKKGGNFAKAVERISAALYVANSPEARLRTMMQDWELALPMASAVLTVLYPSEFSVYDTRVFGQLKGNFEELAHRQFSDDLWLRYRQFLAAVNDAAPGDLRLRDKDRYLWARSFCEGVEKDLNV